MATVTIEVADLIITGRVLRQGISRDMSSGWVVFGGPKGDVTIWCDARIATQVSEGDVVEMGLIAEPARFGVRLMPTYVKPVVGKESK